MNKKSGLCISAATLLATAGVSLAEPTAPAVLKWDSVQMVNSAARGADGETLGDGVVCLWDNGPCDVDDMGNINDAAAGLQSQVWPGSPPPFEAYSADDFFVKDGDWWSIEKISVTMAISTNVAEEDIDVSLLVWSDCDGCPDQVEYTFPMVEATFIGAGSGDVFGDTNFYEICFDPEVDPDLYHDPENDIYNTCPLFLTGDTRYWLSPIGASNGVYYWVTANNEKVQGSQGKFRSPHLGYPEWTDNDDIDSDKIDCQDMCFKIYGKNCCLLRDQGNYDLAGLSSLDFPSSALFSSRSVDQFQVAPGADQAVCRLEAYLATNCLLEHTFAEIWNNDCDMPFGTPVRLDVDKVYATGDFFDGMPVYCFVWSCPDIVLRNGDNYWFSIVAQGQGVAGERGVFLFKEQELPCDIYIREGKYKNKFFGYDDFTPVSDPGLEGTPREFAFRIWTRPASDDVDPNTTGGGTPIRGKIARP